jgi:Flp pilus assembly protein TadG
MKPLRRVAADQQGVAAVEMALALPILVVMLYMFIQLGEIYRAMSGIQQSLGQGARYATLCLNPSTSGCTVPTGQQVHDKVLATVYGIGPGTFNANTPALQNDGSTGKYYDLTVTYSQRTSLLLFPGPTVNVSRSKRVWVAGS